jgi:hypothetical protein
MARKNVNVYQILTDESLAANFNSAPTLVKNLDNCSYQINVTTSDSTGSFKVQASNDYAIDETVNTVTNAGQWFDLTLAGGTPTVSGANDVIGINLNQLPFVAIRLSYTSTIAGTGTCSATIVTKQIGG